MSQRSDVRFLVDECVARPIMLAMRGVFADVRSVAEEAPGLADIEVLRWALKDKRVLVTEDYDFGHLAFRSGLAAHAIVILGPGLFRAEDTESGGEICARIAGLERDLERRLTILEREKTRQRDLP